MAENEVEEVAPIRKRLGWADDAPLEEDTMRRGFFEAPVDTLERYADAASEVGLIAAEGIGMGAQKFYYDGASAVNSLVGHGSSFITNTKGRPVFDMGDDYWHFMKREFNITPGSNAVKGIANMSAMLLSIQTGSKALGSIPQVAKWMQTGGSAAKFGKSMLSSGLLGASADMINTRSGDVAMAKFLPEQYQNDFTRWLSDRTGDSEIQGRMKNAVEGLVLGAVTDSLFGAIGAIYRGIKTGIKSTPTHIEPAMMEEAEKFIRTLTPKESLELEQALKASTPSAQVLNEAQGAQLPFNIEMTGGNGAIRTVGNLGTTENQMLHWSKKADRVRKAYAEGADNRRVLSKDLIDTIHTEHPDMELGEVQDIVEALRGTEAGTKLGVSKTPKKAPETKQPTTKDGKEEAPIDFTSPAAMARSRTVQGLGKEELLEKMVAGPNEGIIQVSNLGATLTNKLHIAHQSEYLRAAVERGAMDMDIGLQGIKKIILEASSSTNVDEAFALAEAVMTGGSGDAIKAVYKNSAVGSAINPKPYAPEYRIGQITPEEAQRQVAKEAAEHHEILMKDREDALNTLRMLDGPISARSAAEKFTNDSHLFEVVSERIDEKVLADGHAVIRAMVDSEEDALTAAAKTLNDETSSDADRQIALTVQDFFAPDGKLKTGRLNPETSGDEFVAQATRMAHLMKGISGLSQKKVKHNVDTIYEAIKKYDTGTLSLELEKFAKETAYDLPSLKRQVVKLDLIMGDGLGMLQVARVKRHDLATDLQMAAEAFVKVPARMKNVDEMAAFMNTLRLMDELDHSIAGTLSTAGRMLQIQKVSPAKFGSLLAKARAANDAKGATEEATTFGSYMAQLIMQDDKIAVEALMRSVASGVMSPKELRRLLEGDKAMDFVRAGYLGSLLSGFKTVSATVLMGNVVAIGVKNVMVPFFKGIINQSLKLGGKNISGASPIDAAIGARSIMESTSAAIGSVMESTKGLKGWKEGLTAIGSAEREGVTALGIQTRAGMSKRVGAYAKKLDKDGFLRTARLVDLIKPIHSLISGIQSVPMRAISNIDAVTKHTIIDAELRMAAHQVWRKEGGSRAFGDVNEEIFIKEFGRMQRDMMDIFASSISSDMFQAGRKEQFRNIDPRLLELVDDSINQAEKSALEGTLQQDIGDTFVGGMLASADKWANDRGVAAQMTTLMLWPFRQAPVNSVREILDHTPVASISILYKALHGTKQVLASGQEVFVKSTPEEVLHASAKVVAGTTMMATIATFVDTGRITGTIFEGDRSDAEAAGRIPHSFFVGGKWYSYAKLGPVAALMSATADYERFRDRFPDSTKLSLFAMPLVAVSQESHFRTFMDLFDALTGEDLVKDTSSFVVDKITGVLTPLAGATVSVTDMLGENVKYRSRVDAELGSLYNELHAVFAKAQTANPLWRTALGATGFADFEEDITSRGSVKKRFSDDIPGRMLNFLGLANNDADHRPSTTAMIELGMIQSNMSTGTIDGVSLTRNEQKDLLAEAHTEDVNDRLDEAVESSQFKSMGVAHKRAYLKSIRAKDMDLIKLLKGKSDPRIRESIKARHVWKILQSIKQDEKDTLSELYHLNAKERKVQGTFENFERILNKDKK